MDEKTTHNKLMKLDYNSFIHHIDEVLSNSRSKLIKEEGFYFELGINILSEYLKLIAERAIEINDEVLIELLKGIGIVKESEE